MSIDENHVMTALNSVTSQLSDDAIWRILEIIASEIDDVDDKELFIQLD